MHPRRDEQRERERFSHGRKLFGRRSPSKDEPAKRRSEKASSLLSRRSSRKREDGGGSAKEIEYRCSPRLYVADAIVADTRCARCDLYFQEI